MCVEKSQDSSEDVAGRLRFNSRKGQHVFLYPTVALKWMKELYLHSAIYLHAWYLINHRENFIIFALFHKGHAVA
jgi:hypothetical protein